MIWLLYAVVIFIPFTAVNSLLWALIPCEWDRPYGMIK